MKYASTALPNNAALESELPAAEKRRKRPENQVLSPNTRIWFANLPAAIRPVQLSKAFPRICNSLAEYWPEPEHVTLILNDLLLDKRGDRQGFPLAIAMEISTLKEHFTATYASQKLDIWDRTPGLY